MLAILSDKFKGTLTSQEAAAAICDGLYAAWPEAECAYAPMADGGEGTAQALGAEPHGSGLWYELPSGDAYVPSCGEGMAWQSTLSEGTLCQRSTEALGHAIRQAVDSGRYRRVYVGIGGTSTADGGTGMLRALGYNVSISPDGIVRSIKALSNSAERAYRRSVSGLADVAAPLIGSGLSAMSFLAQKGATPHDEAAIRRLFMSLTEICRYPAPFGGSGGGIGFAIQGIMGCDCTYGARFVLDRALASLPRPSLIITGEGRIDPQTLGGKVVDTVYSYGASRGIPVAAFAGCADPGAPYPNTFACTRPGEALPDNPAEALRHTAMLAAPSLQAIVSHHDNNRTND
ncbi:MAG: glycerate kinase [Muribaculaceae bacterium]|nr:glycerate kinase [Muribaculaceae bacterium]